MLKRKVNSFVFHDSHGGSSIITLHLCARAVPQWKDFSLQKGHSVGVRTISMHILCSLSLSSLCLSFVQSHPQRGQHYAHYLWKPLCVERTPGGGDVINSFRLLKYLYPC